MATRRRRTTKRKATKKRSYTRRKTAVTRPATRRRKRRIKQSFGVTLPDVLKVGAGAAVGAIASKMLGDKLTKVTEKLPMSDKLDYTGIAMMVGGTFLASKAKKDMKLIALGLGASGFAQVVSGFMSKGTDQEEQTTGFNEDVTAELLSIDGVQRVADYTMFTPIEGVQRVAGSDLENYRCI